MRVDVELEVRTDATVAQEAADKISLLVLALFLLDRVVVAASIAAAPGVAAAPLLLLLLQALQKHEEVVVHWKPSDRVVSGA